MTVLDQLCGSGRGDLGSYDDMGYRDLEEHLIEQKLGGDSEKWLQMLIQKNSRIATRVMEVRMAYCREV